MTPEQKQLEQIRERQLRRYRTDPPTLSIERQALEDIDSLLSLIKSQEAGGDIEGAETTAPQSFKWPKPTLAGYDYALSMAELNGFDNVTDAIVTAVRLRDAGIGLIQVVAEEIAADLGYQGGTENQQELAKKIQDAMNRTAISMRSTCVEKVKTMISAGDERGWDDGYGQVWRQACAEIITALELLSIEKSPGDD